MCHTINIATRLFHKCPVDSGLSCSVTWKNSNDSVRGTCSLRKGLAARWPHCRLTGSGLGPEQQDTLGNGRHTPVACDAQGQALPTRSHPHEHPGWCIGQLVRHKLDEVSGGVPGVSAQSARESRSDRCQMDGTDSAGEETSHCRLSADPCSSRPRGPVLTLPCSPAWGSASRRRSVPLSPVGGRQHSVPLHPGYRKVQSRVSFPELNSAAPFSRAAAWLTVTEASEL